MHFVKPHTARSARTLVKRYARPAVEPASVVGLIRGLFEAIQNVFGVVAPKLELTYEAGKSPYFEADDYIISLLGRPEQAPADTDPTGFMPIPNDLLEPGSTTESSPRRWFRVGIKNRSLGTVEGVRIELASIDPPVIGHLPLPLSIMHRTPQPLTINRASEPTIFADVILKVDADDKMHIMSTVQSPRSLGGIPARRYRLGIRVTGHNTPAVTKHYVADVDDKKRLVFAQE
jgi:hypothetical protein